jgi:hypothetical protein
MPTALVHNGYFRELDPVVRGGSATERSRSSQLWAVGIGIPAKFTNKTAYARIQLMSLIYLNPYMPRARVER